MSHIQKKIRKSPVTGKKSTSYIVRYIGLDGEEHSKSFRKLGSIHEPGTAAHFRNEQDAAIRERKWVNPSNAETLTEFAERWISKRTGVAEGTIDGYQALIRQDIKKSWLGRTKLLDITQEGLNTWVWEMVNDRHWADQNLAPSTATGRRNMLATILTAAVDANAIPKNPMKGVGMPLRDVEVEQVDPDAIPTDTQLWELYDAASTPLNTIIREAIIIAAGTGMRRGEILGLRRKNIRGGEIHVVEQRMMSSRKRDFGALKSKRARRRIPIGETVQAAIDQQMKLQPADREEVLFLDPSGKPWRRSTFTERWVKIRTAAGMEGLHFHYLRHYYASLLISGGENVRVVMDRMGHVSAEETLQRYARLWPGNEAKTNRIVDAALRRTAR